MAASQLGHKRNVGKKLSIETRQRMSNIRKGRTMANAAKENLKKGHAPGIGAKISLAKMGHFTSAESRQKMAAAKKGNTINIGRKHTTEARENMSKAHQAYLRNKKESANG
jgi:hypothetical protein